MSDTDTFNNNNLRNNGPVIGYRRVAGKFALTKEENGVRGAWVEKRKSIIERLQANNYRVQPIGELTDATAKHGIRNIAGEPGKHVECEILMLEFGGTNMMFFGDDWRRTLELIKNHKGKIVFINDDPDLSFPWNRLPDEDYSRWTVAVNAVNAELAKMVLKCPSACKVVDMPMHSNMTFKPAATPKLNQLCYIGRPNSRGIYFKKEGRGFAYSPHIRIVGKPKEWAEYPGVPLLEIPQQRNRAGFYRMFSGCLSVYDEKHAICGWRTGRAYHAVYAGVPSVAPVGNSGLDWCYQINSLTDVEQFINLSQKQKIEIWEKQKEQILKTSNYTIKDLWLW